jgi:hypothetical protein
MKRLRKRRKKKMRRTLKRIEGEGGIGRRPLPGQSPGNIRIPSLVLDHTRERSMSVVQ